MARRGEVSHRLHQAEVAVERVLSQLLAVAGRRDRAYFHVGVLAEYLQKRVAYKRHWVAQVRAVIGKEYAGVLVYDHQLHGGGAGVYAYVHPAGVVGREVGARDPGALVPGLEGVVLLLRLEQRRHGAVVRRGAAAAHTLGDLSEVELLIRIERRAHGDEVQAVFRAHALDAQSGVKALAQDAGERQRSAQIQHVALYRPSLRQTGDGLVHDRLIDARRYVLGARALVYQRLDIALGEDAAAGRYGVGLLGALGRLVQFLGRQLQQRGHLVDERARASRAGAVHADFHRACEEQYLGVLAAQLYDAVGAGREPVRGHARGEDLLHERDAHTVRHAHARTAGYGKLCSSARDISAADTAKEFFAFLQYVAVMALVIAENEVANVIKHNTFYSCRPNIKPDAQERFLLKLVWIVPAKSTLYS